jgi:hypothetical protein
MLLSVYQLNQEPLFCSSVTKDRLLPFPFVSFLKHVTFSFAGRAMLGLRVADRQAYRLPRQRKSGLDPPKISTLL